MQNTEISVEDLQAKIESAFSNVESPALENIAAHDCPECRAVRRVFRNEDWRTIKPRKIEWAYDKLPLFTPEAHQYFLPAFMLYSLREPESVVCEFVFYNLATGKSQVEWWQERLDKFTEEQKAACSLFLRWLQHQPNYDADDSKDIERALKKWWKTGT